MSMFNDQSKLGGGGTGEVVSITGGGVVGDVMIATLASGWAATGYQWTRDGVDIAGQTNSTYTTVSGDAGKQISCKVTGLSNAATGKVIAAAPIPPYVIPLLPLRMIMVSGQSLSIGTMTQASQPPYPAQPELSSKFKLFNAVPAIGRMTATITDAETASLRQYTELESGGQGYYTHGVGAFKWLDTVDDAAQDWLWCPAGVGGATITQVDSGGTYPSYANQQKMLARAKAINAAADVTAIFFSQGEANYGDATPATYTAKLTTYKANQLSAVAAQFPSSTPKLYIDQCGDGLATQRVHFAQANAGRDGLAVLVGPKYWLNRKYPNVAVTEQLHLNVIGYTYQGEMFARALYSELSGVPFKPTMINSIEYVDSTTIKLKCSTPNGGGLVIDTVTLPTCAGYGISARKPTLEQITPTSVTISGSDVICQFAETIFPDFRIMAGYTATDITSDGTASGNYMPLTNIRGAVGNQSKAGLGEWYDWLCLDRHDTSKTTAGYVKPSTLGSELWRTAKVGTTDGLVSSVVFDGTNMVVTKNGVTNAATPTVGFVDGGNNPELYWAVVAGRTYRVTGTVQVTSGAGTHEIRINVGSTGTVKRSSTNSSTLGSFSVDIVAAGTNATLELRVNNVAIVGSISNISVKEVL